MKGFYFDYKILGGESLSDAEYILRQRLQRKISAREALKELGERRGLMHVGLCTERRGETQRTTRYLYQ